MKKTKVLFIGSHCDDIELGCGATIHKNSKKYDIYCLTLCSTGNEGFPAFNTNNLWKTSKKSLNKLGVNKIFYENFPICHFDTCRQKIWLCLRKFNETIQPDIVFTHTNDESRDHQVCHAETIRNFEQASIYCYTPAISTHPSFIPNCFEIVNKKNLKAKQKSLSLYKIYCKKSYMQKHINFSRAVVSGVMSQSKYAEGFQLFRKINVLSVK